MSDFDPYASEYRELVDRSVRLTGESSKYFAAYKAAYIARKIAPRTGCKILDYGCGVGLFSKELKRQLHGVRVDGFDVSPESIQQLDADLHGEGKFTSNLDELEQDYDVVVVANVLHHVEPNRRALVVGEACSRLAAGGKLVVFEHNPLNPLTRRAVAQCPFDEGVKLLPVRESLAHFRANKFHVLAKDYIVFFPRWLSWFRPLEPSLSWCALGAQYAVIGARQPAMNPSSRPEAAFVDPPKDVSGGTQRYARPTLSSILRFAVQNPHAVATLFLTITLVPALKWAHQPLRFDWHTLALAYWVSLAFQSIFAAALFCIIALPAGITWQPLLRRYTLDKRRILLLIPFLQLLSLLFARLVSPTIVPVTIVVAIALLEVFERSLSEAASLKQVLFSLSAPSFYLFLGLLLVFAYNDLAVAARSFVTYDPVLDRADSALLFGLSSTAAAHRLAMRLPLSALKLAETIYYYCMFPQIGGALILIALNRGTKDALRFVGAILTTYYLAIAVFWMWPTMGPFFLGNPGSRLSVGPLTSMVQRQVLAQVHSLWNGRGLPAIGLDYYIAFPSLHIALPLVTAWFVRHWRRLVYCLLAFDLLLTASIFLLEWHYIVDLLGGALAAAMAILIAGRFGDRGPVSSGLGTESTAG